MMAKKQQRLKGAQDYWYAVNDWCGGVILFLYRDRQFSISVLRCVKQVVIINVNENLFRLRVEKGKMN